jgi:hypothetical protein
MKEVSLGTLGSGAAEELFAEEFAKVLANVGDPNTDAKAARELVLKVRVTPNEDRSFGTVSISCRARLAPIKPFETQVFMGLQGGRVHAYEEEIRQPTLPGLGNVLEMREVK